MRYLPMRSLFDQNFFKPMFLEDEEDWPEIKMNTGLNVYEEDNKVIVEAAVPGLTPEKLNVTYENGVLRIYGKVEEKDEEKKGKKVIHQWNKVSTFEYNTYLPQPIDSKSIEAKLKNGVVTIKADVAEEAKAKQIQVKVA